MPSSRSLPGLDKSPKKNWVEKAGGLPSYIERIAKHLHHEKGHSVSSAIAMAISTVKRWAAGGENVKADTRAKAAKAVAEWEKLKSKNASKKLREAARLEIRMTPEEERDLAHRLAGRLMVAEGVLRSLGSGSAASVANATALLEAEAGERVRFQIVRGTADERDVAETRELLLDEIALLSELSEALCPGVLEEMKGKATEAADQASRTTHLQRRLSSLGHQLKDDGVFGPKTDAAVKEFQKGAGLKDDGVVGEKTGEALRSGPAQASLGDEPGADGAAKNADGTPATNADGAVDSAAAALDPARVLFKGIGVGEEAGDPGVQALQGVVGAEGDGRFGPETEKAVKKFQRKAGLKPDGIVAEKTHRVLAGQAKGKEIAEAFLGRGGRALKKFDPDSHPRDREGQFAKAIDKAGEHGVELPNGTQVRKTNTGMGWQIKKGGRTSYARDPKEAARSALRGPSEREVLAGLSDEEVRKRADGGDHDAATEVRRRAFNASGDTPAEKAAKAAGKTHDWGPMGTAKTKDPDMSHLPDTPAEKAAKAAGKPPDFTTGKQKIESYDPKTGPSEAQKAANAARMGLKPKAKKKK